MISFKTAGVALATVVMLSVSTVAFAEQGTTLGGSAKDNSGSGGSEASGTSSQGSGSSGGASTSAPMEKSAGSTSTQSAPGPTNPKPGQ